MILQAQKYSTSSQLEYSTAEAKQLICMSREQHAVPIMFPERQYPVDASLQATLRGIAAETVQAVAPRMRCPADAV